MSKTVFVDADKSQGRPGTVVTAAFLNAVNYHHHTGRDVDGEGALAYSADTGAANAYALALTPALDAYIPGMPIWFKAASANTGAAAVNVNGLGAVAIKKFGTLPLGAGDICSGQIVCVVYDGVNFQLLGRGQAQQGDMVAAYALDAGAANAYAVNLTPAISEYVSGGPVIFKAATANTGASTLNVNSLGTKTIKKRGNKDLQAGDIRAGQIICVLYDGVNFQLFSQAHSGDVLVGTTIMKLSRACPVGYLPLEGATLLRAQYPELFEDMVPQLAAVLQVGVPLVVQAAAHGLAVGDRVRFATTGTLPTGLSTNVDYYIISEGFTENLLEISTARGGAPVAVSGAQSGNHTLFCWNVCEPGDGLATFVLPDNRGEFPRAWDNGRGFDPDRIFGSYQEDAIQGHRHPTSPLDSGSGGVYGNGAVGPITSSGSPTGDPVTDGTNGTPRVASETRSKNRAFRFFIKY